MYIQKVQLKNFGKFHEKALQFSDGINVIYGGNESGKTTLHTFITSMLFGLEKGRGRVGKQDMYSACEPWNSASYYVGNMTMTFGKKAFFLERNFYHKEKRAILQNLIDGEELSVEFGDLQMLLGGMTKEGYENTYCIRQAGFLADSSLGEALENYMADVSGSGDGSVRISAAIGELQKKRKQSKKALEQKQKEREDAAARLKTEEELLKGDIAIQKNGDFAKKLLEKPDEATMERTELSPLVQKGRAYLWIAFVLFIAAGLVMFFGNGISNFAAGVFFAAGVLLGLLNFLLKKKLRLDTGKKSKEDMELANGLNEIREQWKEKENRCHNLEEQLFELSEPSELEEKLLSDIRSLELAEETLQKISERIHEEIVDILHETVSENLSKMTGGKYDSMLLDEQLHLYIWENGKKLPVGKLSRGTLEQAYFAMRMAVGDLLMKEEPMPVLLDETFSMYDDERLANTLKWLEGRQNQILIFTCQKREMEQLDRLGISYQKILLQENAVS